ncbi:MAG TPA: AbrB family transcriptional regulator, partial [Limnochordales bacterium]
YLRVMLVLLSAPLLVVVAHGLEGMSGVAGAAGAGGLAAAAGSGAVPAAQAAASAAGQASAAGAAGAHLGGAALGVAVVASGFVLGRRLPLPAASLLASMVVGALVATFAPVHPAVPFPVSVGAFLVLGTFVGSRFEREVLHRAWPVALAAVGSSLVLMAANLAIGWGLHLASGLPVLTAVLATAPGAIETMTAMAVATGANPGLVLSVHVARFFLALLLGPLVTGLLTGRRRGRARPGAAAGRKPAPAPAAGPGTGAGSHQAFASAANRPRRPR